MLHISNFCKVLGSMPCLIGCYKMFTFSNTIPILFFNFMNNSPFRHILVKDNLTYNLIFIFFWVCAAITLDWLRLNCMEIFDYLANQLKGTPLFENDDRKLTKIKRVVLFSTILIFSLMSYYQKLIMMQCLEQYQTPA